MISNELEVTLPLDLSEISLPDPSLRKLDKDYYDEYIEIIDMNDGSGPKRSKLNYFKSFSLRIFLNVRST